MKKLSYFLFIALFCYGITSYGMKRKSESYIESLLFEKYIDPRGLLLDAIKSKNIKKIRSTLKIVNPNVVINTKGITPLHVAAAQGFFDGVRILLEYGAIIEPVDLKGVTPLHIAADMSKIEVVQFLITKGANINGVDYCGFNPLFYALRDATPEMIKVLIEYGANVHQMSKTGWTTLHFAVRRGLLEIVRRLLDLQVAIDAISDNEYGWTALHFACHEGYLDIVKLLLEYNADYTIKSLKENVTPLDVAQGVCKNYMMNFISCYKNYRLFWAFLSDQDNTITLQNIVQETHVYRRNCDHIKELCTEDFDWSTHDDHTKNFIEY